MKRFSILLCIMLFISVFTVSAEESILIDFSQLAADDGGENAATLIDFSNQAGTSFTDEEKALMKVSLAVDNWVVLLASSSRTVANQSLSLTKEAPVKTTASNYAGEKVMGVRVHFPSEPFNSWAMIRPPFKIPAYHKSETTGEDQFDGYGVVKNVGVLKSVTVNIMGKNFPNGFAVILRDQENKEYTVFMDYLQYDGWKSITWNNPNYISEVRNRELKRYPLYPKSMPSMALVGFVFYKDAAQEGGDFITYIKDVKLTYDLAVLDVEGDVDDEALWGILEDREESRKTAEFKRLGASQVLQALEQRKMHVDEEETTSTTE